MPGVIFQKQKKREKNKTTDNHFSSKFFFFFRSIMYSSDTNKNSNSNSIRNALFDAAVQLSVPTVTSTASVANKLRAHSTTEDSFLSLRSRSPSPRPRHSLSSTSTHFSRHSDVIPSKILRDVATQSSPMITIDENSTSRPNHLQLTLDNNNNPTVTSSISDTSREYLSVPKPHHHRSPSSSPTRHGKSIKNTLLGIWQGLNNDELRSAASSPIDPKFFEDRVRIVIFFDFRQYSSMNCSRVHPVGRFSRKLSLHY